ncbi:hypothetical protein [Aliarcobacter butzleri]|uniref:hypothetical protein n=1 Tax=Aliarcobacter butzleri TaxID=28197 RepID=UPI0012606D4A|nr:hypothetical protein [Aliarcobacter butzleri]
MKKENIKIELVEDLKIEELENLIETIEIIIKNKEAIGEKRNKREKEQNIIALNLYLDNLEDLNINSLSLILELANKELKIKKNVEEFIYLDLKCKYFKAYAATLTFNKEKNEIEKKFANLEVEKFGKWNKATNSYKASYYDDILSYKKGCIGVKYGDVVEIRNNTTHKQWDNIRLFAADLDKDNKLYLKSLGSRKLKMEKVEKYLKGEIKFKELIKRGK